MSLDGYVADAHGNFDWSVPDDEVHAFVNDLERPIGTYLYGRRLYDVMKFWEDVREREGQTGVAYDFARLWRAADKVVYSRTLERVTTKRTQLERTFLPETVRAMKATAERDISVGGSELAAQAFAAGLIDECRLFLSPVIVGGGTPGLPRDVLIGLQLEGERRFRNGVVYLQYRVTGEAF
jgi:dihydrofolate reductase